MFATVFNFIIIVAKAQAKVRVWYNIGMYQAYVYAVALLALAVLVGFAVVRLPLLRKIFLPTAVAAGIFLLLMGPEVVGKHLPEWSFPREVYAVWSELPHLLINIVFATLFLGKPLIKIKDMWQLAGPQVAFGQMIAWGQYALGGLLVLLFLGPLFQFPAIGAALLEISFEGGHGTVAGLSRVFDELEFSEGRDIAVGLATASLVSALLLGIVIINVGRKLGLLHESVGVVSTVRNKVYTQHILHEIREKGVRVRQYITPWNLAHHGLLIGVGVATGWLIHRILLMIEMATWANSGVIIMGYLPIFPICMFGGMLAQILWHRMGFTISREIVNLYSSSALLVLIATAIGTMSLEFLTNSAVVFATLYLAGVLWIIFAFVFLAKRMFTQYWFENAIVSFGQGMGMTATGLLFAQMTDPKNKTGAVEGFGYKQLMFEPFMGGGIVTALSMPIILAIGLPLFTFICGSLCLGWMIFGLHQFRPVKRL